MDNFEIDHRYRLNLKRDGPNTLGGLRWIHRLAVRMCTGTGLDVGPCGVTADESVYVALPGAIPVDPRLPGTGDFEHIPHPDGSMDYVFSSHTIEHVANPEAAMAEVHRVLRKGGLCFLFLPYPGHDAWDPDLNIPARSQHPWQPTPASIGRLMLMAGLEPFYVEYERDYTGSFLALARKP